MQSSTNPKIKQGSKKGSKKNKKSNAAIALQIPTFINYCDMYNVVFYATSTEIEMISEMWKNIQNDISNEHPKLDTYDDMITYLMQKNISAPIDTKFQYQYFINKLEKYKTLFQKFIGDYKHNIFCVKKFMKTINVSTMETFKIRLDQIMNSSNRYDHYEQEHEEWLTFARYVVHFIEDEMQRDPTMSNPLLY